MHKKKQYQSPFITFDDDNMLDILSASEPISDGNNLSTDNNYDEWN